MTTTATRDKRKNYIGVNGREVYWRSKEAHGATKDKIGWACSNCGRFENDCICAEPATSIRDNAAETPRGNLVCGAPLMGRTCLERKVKSPCGNCRAWLVRNALQAVKEHYELSKSAPSAPSAVATWRSVMPRVEAALKLADSNR